MITYATSIELLASPERLMPALASWLSTISGSPVTTQTLAREDRLVLPKATVEYMTYADPERSLLSLRIHHHRQSNSNRRTDLGWLANGEKTSLTFLVNEQREEGTGGASPTPGLIPLLIGNWPSPAATPRGRSQALTTEQESVTAFISLIHDPARIHPILLVSPDRQGRHLVDPEALAARAIGLAHVVTMLDPLVGHHLDGLLDTDMGAHSGAIRAIDLSASLRPSHWLWTPTQLQQTSIGKRIDAVLGQTIANYLKPLVLATHVTSSYVLEAQRRQLAAQFSQNLSATIDMDRRSLNEYVAVIETELDEVNGLNAIAQAHVQQLTDELERSQGNVMALEGVILQLRSALVNAVPQKTALPDFQRAMQHLVGGAPTLHDTLVILTETFPERLVILPTAWDSARHDGKFLYLAKAFDLLWKLTTDYWECMVSGGGDAEARHIFGNAYAASESEHVVRNEQARRNRTFVWDGESIPFWRHLKIGHTDSAAECLRIHFHWDATTRRLAIGHVGPHLSF